MTARSPRPRGLSRVRRHTYDIDSREGAIHAPLGGDGTLESARLAIKALLLMIDEVQVATANAVQYSQGLFGRAGVAALKVLFDPKHGFDHFSGTNDLANSQIAERMGCNPRHWQRLKKRFAELGIITYVHRSMKTGLATAPGVDQDIQISDLYYFSPDDLARRAPWLREIYDQTLGRLKRERYARETREESRGNASGEIQRVRTQFADQLVDQQVDRLDRRMRHQRALGIAQIPVVIEVDRLRVGLVAHAANAVDCGSRSRPRTLASASSAWWPRSTASRSLPKSTFPIVTPSSSAAAAIFRMASISYRIAGPAQFTSRFARISGTIGRCLFVQGCTLRLPSGWA